MITLIGRRLLVLRIIRMAASVTGSSKTHAFEVALATALRTELTRTKSGRFVLRTYKLAMSVLSFSAASWVLLALIVGIIVWKVEPWMSMVGIFFVIPSIILMIWRLVWGAPLAWLNEYDDSSKSLSLRELPVTLRQLAQEAQALNEVPAKLEIDLRTLANETDHNDATK